MQSSGKILSNSKISFTILSSSILIILALIFYLTFSKLFINPYTVITYSYSLIKDQNLNIEALPYDEFRIVIEIEGYFPLPSILVRVHSMISKVTLLGFPYCGVCILIVSFLMASYFINREKQSASVVHVILIASFILYLIARNIYSLGISRAELGNVYSLFLLTLTLKWIRTYFNIHNFSLETIKKDLIVAALYIIAQLFTHYTNLAISIALLAAFMLWVILFTKVHFPYKIMHETKTIIRIFLLLSAFMIIIVILLLRNPYIASSIQVIYRLTYEYLSSFSIKDILDTILMKKSFSAIINIKYDPFSNFFNFLKDLTARILMISGGIILLYSLLKRKFLMESYVILASALSLLPFMIYNIVARVYLSVGLVPIFLALYWIYFLAIGSKSPSQSHRKHKYGGFMALMLVLLELTYTVSVLIVLPYGVAGTQILSPSYIEDLSALANLIAIKSGFITGDEMLLFTLKYLSICRGSVFSYKIELIHNTKIYNSTNNNTCNVLFSSHENRILVLISDRPVLWGDVFGYTIMRDLLISKFNRCYTDKLFDSILLQLYSL